LKPTNPDESHGKTQTPVENSLGNANASEICRKTPMLAETPPGNANIDQVDLGLGQSGSVFYWTWACLK
jgi:hypothetical protein